MTDIVDTLITIGFFLNPFNIFTFLWKIVTGRVDLGNLDGNGIP